jgi:3-deoxy-7-phosphoheptulonate synthase
VKKLSIKISDKIKLAIRHNGEKNRVIKVGNMTVGGTHLFIVAGPCSVESREQLLETAVAVKKAGANALRGGAFKPRTLPYSFQGMGEEGLKILAEARDATGLPVVTEVMSPNDVEVIESYADVLQIGARNMQNYPLLKKVGRAEKPVLLKRGMSATMEEWLGSAEYILLEGNQKLILCERGLRSFDPVTRNLLDLTAVPLIKQVSTLPIMIDPSHGTGVRSLVAPMSNAGVSAGADGLLLEVHIHPEEALSDGAQSLDPLEFMSLMEGLRPFAKAAGKVV